MSERNRATPPGICLCPHGCGAKVRPVRNPRLRHTAYLDLDPIHARPDPRQLGEKPEPALVVFEGEKGGARVLENVYPDDRGTLVGYTVHRFHCPMWPEQSARAPIKRPQAAQQQER